MLKELFNSSTFNNFSLDESVASDRRVSSNSSVSRLKNRFCTKNISIIKQFAHTVLTASVFAVYQNHCRFQHIELTDLHQYRRQFKHRFRCHWFDRSSNLQLAKNQRDHIRQDCSSEILESVRWDKWNRRSSSREDRLCRSVVAISCHCVSILIHSVDIFESLDSWDSLTMSFDAVSHDSILSDAMRHLFLMTLH